jgi:ferredoxin-fold anticodon binding domain-containing protein
MSYTRGNMVHGMYRFLARAIGKSILITTLSPQRAVIIGVIEKIDDDIVIVRAQDSGGQICIRLEAIATVEEPPTAVSSR